MADGAYSNIDNSSDHGTTRDEEDFNSFPMELPFGADTFDYCKVTRTKDYVRDDFPRKEWIEELLPGTYEPEERSGNLIDRELVAIDPDRHYFSRVIIDEAHQNKSLGDSVDQFLRTINHGAVHLMSATLLSSNATDIADAVRSFWRLSSIPPISSYLHRLGSLTGLYHESYDPYKSFTIPETSEETKALFEPRTYSENAIELPHAIQKIRRIYEADSSQRPWILSPELFHNILEEWKASNCRVSMGAAVVRSIIHQVQRRRTMQTPLILPDGRETRIEHDVCLPIIDTEDVTFDKADANSIMLLGQGFGEAWRFVTPSPILLHQNRQDISQGNECDVAATGQVAWTAPSNRLVSDAARRLAAAWPDKIVTHIYPFVKETAECFR